MPVTVINSYEQFKDVIAKDQPALIDFWATWCGPCKVISPVLEKISDRDTSSPINFYKVDIEEIPDAAEEVQIRVVPTFMLFQNGSKIHEVTGAVPQALETLVKQALALQVTKHDDAKVEGSDEPAAQAADPQEVTKLDGNDGSKEECASKSNI